MSFMFKILFLYAFHNSGHVVSLSIKVSHAQGVSKICIRKFHKGKEKHIFEIALLD